MADRLWVLGASDPEMVAIERLLHECGERVVYAVGQNGQRVHPGNAYRLDPVKTGLPDPRDTTTQVVFVECGVTPEARAEMEHPVIVIDHHRPGDPGFGRPPEEFWPASSIGQAAHSLARLGIHPHGYPESYTAYAGREVPAYHLMTAAADHCLEAAYRGRCPGVDPDALMRWRAESRAAFQQRPVEAVLADIEYARERLREKVEIVCTQSHDRTRSVCEGCAHDHLVYSDSGYPLRRAYADLRGEHIPELPEAAAREGIPFLADQVDRDGRRKVVLMAAPPELVQRFLAGEIVPGLVETYGDPMRGLAGGYHA